MEDKGRCRYASTLQIQLFVIGFRVKNDERGFVNLRINVNFVAQNERLYLTESESRRIHIATTMGHKMPSVFSKDAFLLVPYLSYLPICGSNFAFLDREES
jgi:hypothetical protein